MNLSRLGMDDGRYASFTLSPCSEQRRIVARVDELMVLVDKLEARQNTARTAASNLLAVAIAELTREPKTVVIAKN